MAAVAPAEVIAALRAENDALRAENAALERRLRRHLDALAAGRAKAIAAAERRARNLRALVFDLAVVDVEAGNPRRGRGKRIALGFPVPVTQRHVNRILDELFGASNSLGSNREDLPI